MRILTGTEMREADRRTIEDLGVSSLLLMENAGRGIVEWIAHNLPRWSTRRYLIVCGPGNNGGDGLVVARHLRLRGVAHVDVVLFGRKDRVRGDAFWNLAHYTTHYGPVEEITDLDAWHRWVQTHPAGWDVLIDALFGTGLKRPLEGWYAAWVEEVNAWSGVTRIAVDVPSGLSTETWQLIGPAVRAHVTLTLAAPKICMIYPPAAEYVGRWVVIPIGIPPAVLAAQSHRIWPEPADLAAMLPNRPLTAHKGHFGRVLVLGGGPGKLGAAYMAGMSALRIGAGLVTVCVPESLWPALMASANELMTLGVKESDGYWCADSMETLEPLLDRADVLVIGPGMGTHPTVAEFLRILWSRWTRPVVVDADGLNLIAQHADLRERVPPGSILTPHWGEMARLIGQSTEVIDRERFAIATRWAQDTQTVLVLKGYRTLIALPDGRVFINPSGNPGMATAGMGDILSGFIGGLLAQTGDPVRAAVLGVYLHGRAGDLAADRIGQMPLTATDLWTTIGAAIAELVGTGSSERIP